MPRGANSSTLASIQPGTRKGIVFDLYFTLLWEDFSGPFYDTLAKDLGIEPAMFIVKYRSLSVPSMLGQILSLGERVYKAALLCGLSLQPKDVDKIVETRQSLFYDHIHLYEDASQTIELLRSGQARLGLASNASKHSYKSLLDSGIAHHFDATVLSWEIGCLKPDPHIYRDICAKIGVTPHNSVFIGDGGDQELRGAREVGMTTILIDRSLSHTASARTHADHEVANLLEVVTVLEKLGFVE